MEARTSPGLAPGLRLLRTGPAFILVALILVMSGMNKYFLTFHTLQNLLTQTTMVAALALGQLLLIVVRGVDVSVGSVLGLTVVMSGLSTLHAKRRGGPAKPRLSGSSHSIPGRRSG